MLKLIATGRIGKDATVNSVGNTKVINFSIAHSEKYKDKDGNQQEKTVWIDCAKWGEHAGVSQYLTKGTQVLVEGTPEVKTFEKDGNTKATLAIRILNLELLGGGNREATKPEPEPINSGDDLPF